MITVTLGTIPYQFDRAILWVNKLIEREIIQEDLFIQYGVSNISDLNCSLPLTSEATVEYGRMQSILASSRLVISHAGQGSTRQLAAQGVRFLLLPRLAKYGEHIDNHQLIFAQSVASFGVKHCLTFEELEQAVLSPPEPLPGPLLTHPKLSEHLLSKYPPRKRNK